MSTAKSSGKRLWAATGNDLAEVLGRSATWVCRYSRKPWFPPKTKRGWDVDAVVAACEANLETMKPFPTRARPPLPGTNGDRLDVLDRADDPLAVARAVVGVAARRLAAAERESAPVRGDIQDLKKALEELRRTEAGLLDLQERQGLLMRRSDAQLVAGKLGQRLLTVLSNLRSLLGTQVLQWLADPDFLDAPVDEKRRRVSRWFEGQEDAHRFQAAEELRALVDEVMHADE